MGWLLAKAAACAYNEYDRRLTEQFIHWLDDEDMISEIIGKISALEYINDATSEWCHYGPKGYRLKKHKKKH